MWYIYIGSFFFITSLLNIWRGFSPTFQVPEGFYIHYFPMKENKLEKIEQQFSSVRMRADPYSVKITVFWSMTLCMLEEKHVATIIRQKSTDYLSYLSFSLYLYLLFIFLCFILWMHEAWQFVVWREFYCVSIYATVFMWRHLAVTDRNRTRGRFLIHCVRPFFTTKTWNSHRHIRNLRKRGPCCRQGYI